MKTVERIDELIKALMCRGEPISPMIILGVTAFKKLLVELSILSAADGELTYNHHLGPIKLRHSMVVEDNSISMNGRTVDDIIAEEILLGIGDGQVS